MDGSTNQAGMRHTFAPRGKAFSSSPRNLLCALLMTVTAVVLSLPVLLETMLADSTEARARKEIDLLDRAVAAYYLKHGFYPETLKSLTTPPDNTPAIFPDAPLLDPWGQSYQYEPFRVEPPPVYSWGPPGGNNIIRGAPRKNS